MLPSKAVISFNQWENKLENEIEKADNFLFIFVYFSEKSQLLTMSLTQPHSTHLEFIATQMHEN